MKHPKSTLKDITHFLNDAEYATTHIGLMQEDFVEFVNKYYKITPPLVFFNFLWAETARYMAESRVNINDQVIEFYSKMAEKVTREVMTEIRKQEK